jgi:hypothetical protein
VSERRNLEYQTKTGRGVIHTRPVTDAYREGWERTFRKRKEITKQELRNNAVRQGQER